MALHIDAEIERLATEIAQATGESETEALRRLLIEKKKSLDSERQDQRANSLRRWLEQEVWPTIPQELREQPVTKEYYDSIWE